jgi:hypothetical protein
MTAIPGTQGDVGGGPSARPTAVGYVLRVLRWPLFVAISAAVLIPLVDKFGVGVGVLGLVLAGIARAVLGIRASWLNIVAIPVAVGVMLPLVLAPAMLTLTTGERVPFTVGEFTDTARCTLKEVGGTRVLKGVGCNDSTEGNWEKGSEVEFYVGGVLPQTMDDGTPWEADRLEKNFSWVLPVFVISVLVGLAIMIVKVHRTYWRRTPRAV